jgi:hypothetical protein
MALKAEEKLSRKQGQQGEDGVSPKAKRFPKKEFKSPRRSGRSLRERLKRWNLTAKA